MQVCCIDLRVPIQEFLQISPEGRRMYKLYLLMYSLTRVPRTEAFVIRNCGGRVKPNLNDLIFMEATQEGALQSIIVIHHTGNY